MFGLQTNYNVQVPFYGVNERYCGVILGDPLKLEYSLHSSSPLRRSKRLSVESDFFFSARGYVVMSFAL